MSNEQQLEPTDPHALAALVEGTAGETGEEFFRSLARNLARVMEMHVAWVTEYLPDTGRLRALGMWIGDAWVDDYEYDLPGTPCAPVVDTGKLVHFPDRLLDLFPGDPDLKPLGVVSYLGVPFIDTDGRVLGHLAVMDTRPMPEDPRKLALFNIFANRTSAELRRLRVEKDLRTREQELGLLVNSAMDAIVEIDSDRSVTLLNKAGESLFGHPSDTAVGQSFDRFLVRESVAKLQQLIAQLDGLSTQSEDDAAEGSPSLWVSGGFEAVGPAGNMFAAEATLSRFEVEQGSRYTLILRSVEERLEAERRIRSLTVEAEMLREELHELHAGDEIIGSSPAMTALLAQVKQVARTDSTVLLLGETGTGKELVARAVHAASTRSERPLVKVNCAAIPANLMESEFFGHVKGAFTGATSAREGRFSMADGGTIFLDEVGELPLDLQAKLLRVLQEGEVTPVGSNQNHKVDVRVIAATNRDLQAAASKREFREDLFYRLNVFPMAIPPLRERGQDVALLAQAFADRYAARMGRSLEPLSDGHVRRLTSYSWPGNVRELQNVIERAVITSDTATLDLARALPSAADPNLAAGRPEVEDPASANRESSTNSAAVAQASAGSSAQQVLTVSEMRELEKRNISNALSRTGGRISGASGAAQLLGMKPTTLTSRLKALGLWRKNSG